MLYYHCIRSRQITTKHIIRKEKERTRITKAKINIVGRPTATTTTMVIDAKGEVG